MNDFHTRGEKRAARGPFLLAGILLFGGCGPQDSEGDWDPQNRDAGSLDAMVPQDAATDAMRADAMPRPRTDGSTGEAGVPDPDCGKLTVVVRDFQSSHADFESYVSLDFLNNFPPTPGIVQTTLGDDKKPVFAQARSMVTSASTFNEWYRDVDGKNVRHELLIEMVEESPGLYVFEDQCFFPLDGLDNFGNETFDGSQTDCGAEYQGKNFHFTTEAHTKFTYEGGEHFTFRGDDDLWIFVNGRLALDLGGVHFPHQGTIDFDAKASELGIVTGQEYPMDIFHAERHTTQSHFRVETNIECLKTVVVI